MDAIYGVDCATPDDTVSFSSILGSWAAMAEAIIKYIKVAEATLDNVSHALIPGSFVVDLIPWCTFFLCYNLIFLDYFTNFDFGTVKYLPYLGLPFQKHVRDAQKQVKLMVERPFKHVVRERVN